MLIKIHVATLKLSREYSKISLVKKVYADILFLQEVQFKNLYLYAYTLGMRVLVYNSKQETAVLFNEQKFKRVDNYIIKEKITGKRVWVYNVHLSDIPSVVHHKENISYGGVPLEASMDDIIFLCRKNRLPPMMKLLSKFESASTDKAIIGGNFNEPSHLDVPHLKLPVSKLLADRGFTDAFRNCYIHKNGFTWPSNKYFKNKPSQRIDYIYVKNVDVLKTNTLDFPFTDHKMVYSEMLI